MAFRGRPNGPEGPLEWPKDTTTLAPLPVGNPSARCQNIRRNCLNNRQRTACCRIAPRLRQYGRGQTTSDEARRRPYHSRATLFRQFLSSTLALRDPVRRRLFRTLAAPAVGFPTWNPIGAVHQRWGAEMPPLLAPGSPLTALVQRECGRAKLCDQRQPTTRTSITRPPIRIWSITSSSRTARGIASTIRPRW